MANTLPKIINNDPENVTISTTTQVIASDEFEFIVNCTNESLVINSTLAEIATHREYASTNPDITILRSGKYTISVTSFGAVTAEIAPNGINYFTILSASGTVNVFLNKGAKIRTTGNPIFAISGAAESFTNVTYKATSGDSFGSNKFVRSAYKKIS